MNEAIIFALLIYLAVISVVACLAACIDKYRSQKHKWRIPERTLIIFALLGGATAEYLTMKLIRHKTRHNKFMIGLPFIILFHAVIIVLIYITK